MNNHISSPRTGGVHALTPQQNHLVAGLSDLSKSVSSKGINSRHSLPTIVPAVFRRKSDLFQGWLLIGARARDLSQEMTA